MTEEQSIITALDTYFSREKKFIDTSRIPLICQDIHGLHEEMKEMNLKMNNYVTSSNGISGATLPGSSDAIHWLFNYNINGGVTGASYSYHCFANGY